VIYLFWRDFGRREIGMWDARKQWVFYGAAGLLIVDVGWFFVSSPSGRDALAFFVVAAICVYAEYASGGSSTATADQAST